MAKIRTNRTKEPPKGFDKIQSQLEKLDNQLKEVESQKLTKTANKNQNVWEILSINNKKSRYVYELYYKKKLISAELYNWLLKEKYADALLIAKWKKQGYEKLCCLRCLEKSCICRVPKNKEEVKCVNCGCYGCASGG